MRCALLALYFTAVALWAPSASAQLKISESTEYYLITGRNATEFGDAMKRKGPTSVSTGQRAWATASHRVNYDLHEKRSGHLCNVTKPKVTMQIVLRLPKLQNQNAVEKKHLRTWKRMRSILEKHEAVHVRYYRQLGAEIEEGLKRLPAQSSCRKLRTKAARLVKKLKRKNRIKNERFDARDFRSIRNMRLLYSGY